MNDIIADAIERELEENGSPVVMTEREHILPEKTDRFAVLNEALADVSGLTTDPQVRQLASMLRAAIGQIQLPPAVTVHGFTCTCGYYTGVTAGNVCGDPIEIECLGCDKVWRVSV